MHNPHLLNHQSWCVMIHHDMFDFSHGVIYNTRLIMGQLGRCELGNIARLERGVGWGRCNLSPQSHCCFGYTGWWMTLQWWGFNLLSPASCHLFKKHLIEFSQLMPLLYFPSYSEWVICLMTFHNDATAVWDITGWSHTVRHLITSMHL